MLFAAAATLLAAVLALILLWPAKTPAAAKKVAPAVTPAATAQPPAAQEPRKKVVAEKKQPKVLAVNEKPHPFPPAKVATQIVSTPRTIPPRTPTADSGQSLPPRAVPDRPLRGETAALAIDRPNTLTSSTSTRGFTIEVLSRNHRIENSSSFAVGDPELGELGQGDLRAIVRYEGVTQPRGPLTLVWVVDNLPTDIKAVTLNQPVEYGNEPTAGTYRVELRQGLSVYQTFTFRITR